MSLKKPCGGIAGNWHYFSEHQKPRRQEAHERAFNLFMEQVNSHRPFEIKKITGRPLSVLGYDLDSLKYKEYGCDSCDWNSKPSYECLPAYIVWRDKSGKFHRTLGEYGGYANGWLYSMPWPTYKENYCFEHNKGCLWQITGLWNENEI